MIKVKNFIDKRGREISVFCGEDGWKVMFGGTSHYIFNDEGFDANIRKVMKHVRDFFGEVKEVEKEKE